jgi:hypothetical protein
LSHAWRGTSPKFPERIVDVEFAGNSDQIDGGEGSILPLSVRRARFSSGMIDHR